MPSTSWNGRKNFNGDIGGEIANITSPVRKGINPPPARPVLGGEIEFRGFGS
jgi:hypothetical protein